MTCSRPGERGKWSAEWAKRDWTFEMQCNKENRKLIALHSITLQHFRGYYRLVCLCASILVLPNISVINRGLGSSLGGEFHEVCVCVCFDRAALMEKPRRQKQLAHRCVAKCTLWHSSYAGVSKKPASPNTGQTTLKPTVHDSARVCASVYVRSDDAPAPANGKFHWGSPSDYQWRNTAWRMLETVQDFKGGELM